MRRMNDFKKNYVDYKNDLQRETNKNIDFRLFNLHVNVFRINSHKFRNKCAYCLYTKKVYLFNKKKQLKKIQIYVKC